MGNKVVKEHVANAERTGICQLKGFKLKEMPAALLSSAGTLRSLDMSRNKLSSLPAFVGHFENLKQLNLDSNRLRQLPDQLGTLAKLEQLSLAYNKLVDLPDSLEQLGKLKQVNLSNNSFQHFPIVLCRLGQIDCIDLSCNQLTELPQGSGDLNAVELNLSRNRLNCIDSSLANCARLKVLRLDENCLPLDGHFWTPLFVHSQISLLTVEGNLFDMRQFVQLDGHDRYMERYTSTKKKLY